MLADFCAAIVHLRIFYSILASMQVGLAVKKKFVGRIWNSSGVACFALPISTLCIIGSIAVSVVLGVGIRVQNPNTIGWLAGFYIAKHR
jgi:hypothetical protein